MSSRLTTSSYGILALLALRPWSGYELTQQATRSLRFAWPKSERLLYNEPKKLVEHGLATARRESVGERRRTVYTITEEGRGALTEWMATEAEPPVFEAEAFLRLLFADHGTLDDVRATLDKLATDATQTYEQVREINVGYLDGRHPFPERVHLSVLFATFQLELFDLIVRWVDFAKAEVAEWPTTSGLGMTDRTDAILHQIEERRSVLDESAQAIGSLDVADLAELDEPPVQDRPRG
jgi:DNA-binding PadR family transcriptional regulator